ncbi:MAG: FUSC family protein, partial [Methanobacterium sp.]
MEKIGLIGKFKILARPTGSPKWGHAVRAIILMILAGLIAHFLGFDKGIGVIMFVTLLASIIIDISLPIRKVAILAILGLFMTVLAFLSAYLALSSLEIFIFFTVIWAFFTTSLYIFGAAEGSLGFTFFLIYFVAVLMVNTGSTPVEWCIYSVLPYLVVSILFIPKIWLEKKRVSEMVTVGFNPQSSIQSVFLTLKILSGVSLKSNYYDIFKFGSYLKGLRVYSDLIVSRLPSKSKECFNNFLAVADKSSLKISNNFKSNGDRVDLKEMDGSLLGVESCFLENKNNNNVVFELSQGIKDILDKSNKLLSGTSKKDVKKIETSKISFKEVLEANFNINNIYIRHTIRFTLAMTIALIFVYFNHERSVIWVTMGILIILKPDITSTVNNLISRVGFNLFAIIIAIIISFIFPHYVLIWLAFIMLFLFRAFFPGYMGLSIMAITVFIVLVWPTGTVFENAIARLVDISIGGIIAFIFAYVILPSRVTVNLPDQLIKTIKANINYANQVLTISKNYDSNILKCFKKYIGEDNNLEAGIKKLEDTFEDINDDLKLYNGLMILN